MATFDGTAEYYAKFRPDYSQPAFNFLLQLALPNKNEDKLLDLGCGTGELAIPLSSAFKEVHGIDLSSDMINQAQNKARNLGINNISWGVGKVEEVEFDDNSLKMIVIGSAFHWMDYKIVLDKSYRFLKKDGIFALVNGKSIWNGTEEWQLKTKEIIQKYLGQERKAGNSGTYQQSKKSFSEMLDESSFGNHHIQNFEYSLTWNLDQIVGYLYSTSFSSRDLYGDRIINFENELRLELTKIAPDNNFTATFPVEIMWTKK